MKFLLSINNDKILEVFMPKNHCLKCLLLLWNGMFSDIKIFQSRCLKITVIGWWEIRRVLWMKVKSHITRQWASAVSSWLYVLYIDLRPGQTCHSKDGGSCIFHWRGRAWLTIWDRFKIPQYSHKLMHRNTVTCELHDSYFRSMMIKTCHSKDGGRGIFRWPFMGRDWVDVELLYNSVHRKFNEFGDQKSWRNDAVEKTALSRELGPWASGWVTLENEKDTLLRPEDLGRSICCSSVRSPNPSHTQPFQIKWEVYFF